MKVLYLSNNPNLGSTARILQGWLALGRTSGMHGVVALSSPGDFADWLRKNDFPYRVGPMPWPDKWRPVNTVRHAWAVARWARWHRVEVIHSNEHDVYPFARAVRWFLRRPLICHVRFRISREFATWAFGGGKAPDYLLWTSNRQQADCRDAVEGIVPGDRQRVVHLGLDLNTFGTLATDREASRRAWGIEPHEILISTASALRPIKRLTDYVDLVARLAKDDPRIVGLLAGHAPAGDEPYRDELLKRIADTGLGRRLRWVGNLEPVEPLYHASDVFVSTSEYETFGNSVCEAMACRCPVVAYSGGSVPEVLGDAGSVVPVGDLDGLTERVRRLLADPALRADCAARGRTRVIELFNPAKSLETVRGLYTAVTART